MSRVVNWGHVLEHVSEVSKLIKKLKSLLNPGGVMYAEVPQEIWSGLRIDIDPVNHINYFTLNSFSNLFFSNGFELIEKKKQISNYSKTYMEIVWVLARKNDTPTYPLLVSDAQKMLYPACDENNKFTISFRGCVVQDFFNQFKRLTRVQ